MSAPIWEGLDLDALRGPRFTHGYYIVGDDGTKHYGHNSEEQRQAEIDHNALKDAAPALLALAREQREVLRSLVEANEAVLMDRNVGHLEDETQRLVSVAHRARMGQENGNG